MLWVGVEGVHKANLDNKPFIHYKDLTKISFSARSNINAIRAIYEDSKGNLWVGSTSLGVVFFNRQTNASKHFINSDSDKNSLSDNQIRDIIGDSRGFIWFGTKGGADKYDPVSNRFYHYTTESVLKLPNNIVFSIVEDKNENLWFGTWGGIALPITMLKTKSYSQTLCGLFIATNTMIYGLGLKVGGLPGLSVV